MVVVIKLDVFENESLEGYKFRLCSKKDEFGLTWKDISDLIYVAFGKKISKDFLRHEYYGAKKKVQLDELDIGTRILSISDLHCPFNLSISTLNEYRNKIDILIFNGDLSDSQSISKFRKKFRKSYVDEMVETRKLIIDIIELIQPKKVIINYGNHDERIGNYLADKIDVDVLELLPQTNLDYIIDTGFYKYNHEEKTKIFYEPIKKVFDDIEVVYTNNWFCLIGSCLFAHPKAFKNGILGTSEKAYLYFVQEGYNFDTLILAHTHQSSMSKYGKKFLFEQGCFCVEQGYIKSGGLQRPHSQGFMYIVLDKDDKFNYEKSKLICL
jgi:Predicted phosphohydrolases